MHTALRLHLLAKGAACILDAFLCSPFVYEVKGDGVRSICSHCLIRCRPASSAVGFKVPARSGPGCKVRDCKTPVRRCKTTTSMCHMHAVSQGVRHTQVHAVQAECD